MLCRLFRMSTAVVALSGLGSTTVTHASTTLWYNGDPNGRILAPNSLPVPLESREAIFDDFVVPDGTQWHITEIWSNNAPQAGADVTPYLNTKQANWSIRTSMSEQDAGTVLFSGTDSASYSANGYWYNEAQYPIYKCTVSGLSIDLAPGHYWLQVSPTAPVYQPLGHTFGSVSTFAQNAIGQQPSADEAALWGPALVQGAGYSYQRMMVMLGSYPIPNNFAMGVAGTTSAIPEPSTVSLLATSTFLGLGLVRRRRA